MQYSDLEDKVALITGASGGIGLRVAEKHAARSATVVINSRTDQSAQRPLAGRRRILDRVSHVLGDCADYAAAAHVVETAARVTGGIDIVVSAGAQDAMSPRPFADMSGGQIVEAFESRLFARLFPVHAAVPYLKERGGAVVMLRTDAGRHPTPGESIMGAVGASVILLTKALAKELARWRVRVNTVALTLTSDTPSGAHLFAGELPAAFVHEAERQVSRWASADCGGSRTGRGFLASCEAAQVTGQTISANGGLSFGVW